jgi:cell division protein FtsB
MKWMVVALMLVLVGIHYRLWLSESGIREMQQLREAVSAQRSENERLTERNRQLAEEVRDLKQGYTALEERARSDLGMITRNETFYQVVPPEPDAATAPAEPPTRTAAR